MNASDPRPPFYLGIDLGGTNIKSGVVDDTGRPLSSVSIETLADRGPEVGVENLAKAGRLAVEASGLRWEQIKGVGLGSPGTMDLSRGMLLQPPNLPGWNNLPIRDLLAAKLDKPTVLQNDANAAAYGEYWAGAGRNTRSLVLFTLGTGVGCGIITEGKIIEGRHSHGGECGHIIIQMQNGRRCGCGAYGHLEAYASATALVKRAQELLEEESIESSLRKLPPDEITSRAISEAADAGDEAARRLMKETAYYLAVGAVSLLHTIDPDIVLFGGGMIAAGQGFLDDIRQHVQSMAFPAVAKGTRIEYAELGGDAGFIGAAGWAREIFGR
ncbi:ROK family protein [Paludisphaera rhizosphaerae]|uniref:ROK family protein n=1 Tax=Paludisphaera rhizosphaerae TaxID=2711216 RepID=UPI0013ED6694|nr:ROK family protein [Paludisphaera rhizosphaerae]